MRHKKFPIASSAMLRPLLLTYSLLIISVALGCGGKKTVNFSQYSDQQLFEEGMKLMEKKHWNEARERFRYLSRVYIQSPLREQAYLKIGDCYFHEGSAATSLAVSAYQEFIRLYPNSPEAPYALYQIGEVYYRQSPNHRRSQESTAQAVEYYKRVLNEYPNSPYGKQAQDRLKASYEKLAKHEFMIGRFNYQRGRYTAALGRFQYTFDRYPEDTIPPEAFLYMARTLQKFGRLDESLEFLRRLMNLHPDSKYADEARELQDKIQASHKSGESSQDGT